MRDGPVERLCHLADASRYSRRQDLAKAAMAASRVASWPCIGVRIVVVAVGQGPHPWRPFRRRVHLEDAADHTLRTSWCRRLARLVGTYEWATV